MNAPSSVEAEKKDLTPATAAIWAGVFVLIVTTTALGVAKLAGSRSKPLPEATTVAVEPTAPAPDLPPAAPLLPPNLDPNGMGVVTSGTTVPVASPFAPPRASVHVGGGHGGRPRQPARGADPKPVAPAAGPEIPATRE